MAKTGTQASHLTDFSGGLDTLSATSVLPDKVSPSTTNCWYDDMALTKRPGQAVTALTSTVYGRSWRGFAMHTSIFSGVKQLIMGVQAGISRNFLLDTSDTITLGQLNTGGTGNADSAVATAIITGHSTNWLTTAAVGSIFSIGSTVGIIQSVDSNTQLTLTGNFGALNAGASYVITPSWPTSSRLSFAEMNSKTWVCGKGTSAISWDGSAVAYVSAFPQAGYSLSMSNYIFAANTTANPSRLSWSALKDPTTWPAANFVDVSPDDGFPIVGLFYDGQSLCILKYNSMWKLTGTTFDPANPTYTLTQVYTPTDFNCNSPRSVQLFGSGFMIYGLKGLYSYNGAGAVSKILQYDRIRSEWAALPVAGNFQITPDPSVECSSAIVGDSYWLMFNNNSLGYVVDRTGAIWKWSFAANGTVTDMAYLNGTLYGVNQQSAGTAGLIQLNTGNSDAQTTAISATHLTKVFRFTQQQRFGLAYVTYKKQSAGNLTFGYSINGGSFTTTAIDMTTGTGNVQQSAPILIGQIGYTIQFEFINTTAAQTFEVYSVDIDHGELRT